RPSGSSSALRKGGGVNNRPARSTMTLEYSSRRKPQLATFVPLAACAISEATAFAKRFNRVVDNFRVAQLFPKNLSFATQNISDGVGSPLREDVSCFQRDRRLRIAREQSGCVITRRP